MTIKCGIEQVTLKKGYFMDYDIEEPLDVLEVRYGSRGIKFLCKLPEGGTEWFFKNEVEFV